MLKFPSHLSRESISQNIKNRVTKLATKNRGNLSQFIPQKVNIMQVIPGRVRLQCNQWRNKDVSQSLEKVFQNHPVVKKVSTSPITGSLLLELTVDHLSKEQFHQLVQQAVDATYHRRESGLMELMQKTIQWVDKKVK
jgi:hypothetical protein